MRITDIEIEGFRGFAGKRVFNFDADAIIIIGANGNGKTSLFDAILWAISGSIPRLDNEDESFVCLYSASRKMRVAVSLKSNDNGEPLSIIRSFDRNQTTVTVENKGRIIHGPQAEGEIIQHIWREADKSQNSSDTLATVITRCVYLQQDLIREFIDAISDQDRFNAVSELVGAGQITRFQAELTKDKTGWSGETNSRYKQLELTRERLNQLQRRLNELEERQKLADQSTDNNDWDAWWVDIRNVGVTVTPVSMSSSEALEAINTAIKQLDALRQKAARRHEILESLKIELQHIQNISEPDTLPLQDRIATVKCQIEDLREKIAEEQKRAAENRRLQMELSEKSEQLRTLAALALKHLGEKCPVCDQYYNIEMTRQRMESLAQSSTEARSSTDASVQLSGLLESLSSKEKELADAEYNLQNMQRKVRECQSAVAGIESRFEELSIGSSRLDDKTALLRDLYDEVHQTINTLDSTRRRGEEIALCLAYASEKEKIIELQNEISELQSHISNEERIIAARRSCGIKAQKMIEELRNASERVVTERVKDIEPIYGDIFNRIDVHPAFRMVKFPIHLKQGRGRLVTQVKDPLKNVESSVPKLVLSSSQLNAMAISTFLALNLGISDPPLDAALLDDPLQSLDDINLLGLVDLLRKVSTKRQLCISTHDKVFGNLLAQKLRPISDDKKTIVIEIESWNRSGPKVSSYEVKGDPVPYRLAVNK